MFWRCGRGVNRARPIQINHWGGLMHYKLLWCSSAIGFVTVNAPAGRTPLSSGFEVCNAQYGNLSINAMCYYYPYVINIVNGLPIHWQLRGKRDFELVLPLIVIPIVRQVEHCAVRHAAYRWCCCTTLNTMLDSVCMFCGGWWAAPRSVVR